MALSDPNKPAHPGSHSGSEHEAQLPDLRPATLGHQTCRSAW